MRSSVVIFLVTLSALLAPASAFFHVTHGMNAPRATLDNSITCQTCQGVLNEAYVISQNSTDIAALQQALDQDCQSTSSPLICDLVVAALIKELPKLPAKLQKSGIYNAAIACSALSFCAVNCCADNTPNQIHLSTGGSPSAMTVTWVTRDATADVNVRYGTSPSSLTATVTADAHTFTQFGWVGSVHNATMTSLPTDSTIYYQVGGPNSGWSTVRSFQTISDILPTNFTFLITGDLGAEFNFSEADQQYINYAASGKNPALTIDTVIHVGDIAYADGYEERNDLLMTTLEPTASAMPYMTVPGNHEIAYNFVSYKNRFSMPYNASGATLEGMYYSWDAGCVHFVALNSESPLDTPQITADEVAWLSKDLASFAERRAAGEKLRAEMDEVEAAQCSHSAPTFLVVYMHRPMYCSSAGKEDSKRCNDEGSYLRGQVESLLVQYKADLVFSGHVHAYERMTNIVDGAVNAAGPAYILNGAGGNREGLNNNWNPQPYSVFRNGVAGLGTLSVLNSTTLSWQWYQQTDLATALAQGTAPVVNDSAYFYARS